MIATCGQTPHQGHGGLCPASGQWYVVCKSWGYSLEIGTCPGVIPKKMHDDTLMLWEKVDWVLQESILTTLILLIAALISYSVIY